MMINARSGGGQGAAILHTAQADLNEFQVYDITANGPLPGYVFFITSLVQNVT
jgi:hypothetical protein